MKKLRKDLDNGILSIDKETGRLFDPKTGLYVSGPQMGFEQDKNGKVIRGEDGKAKYDPKRIATTTDWVGALAIGLLVSSLVRFSKQSINVYYKGRPNRPKDSGRGFWTGVRARFRQDF